MVTEVVSYRFLHCLLLSGCMFINGECLCFCSAGHNNTEVLPTLASDKTCSSRATEGTRAARLGVAARAEQTQGKRRSNSERV